MAEARDAGGFDVNADSKEVAFWAMVQIWRWIECEGVRDINHTPHTLYYNVQLRSGPSVAAPYKSGQKINSGQCVYVSARSHSWFLVQSEDRLMCSWIRAQY